MKNNKNTTPDKDIYSQEELEFFKTLESDIDKATYQPMDKSELEKESELVKNIAKILSKR
jgi:hypothetical protein